MATNNWATPIISENPPQLAPGGPVQLGQLWVDTSVPTLKRCTSLSPITYVDIEGGGGGGGAPTTATYLLISANGSLPNARTIEAGPNIILDDRGIGGALIISGLASPISNTYVDLTTNQIVSGNKVFNDIQRSGYPSLSLDLVNKSYVDNILNSGLAGLSNGANQTYVNNSINSGLAGVYNQNYVTRTLELNDLNSGISHPVTIFNNSNKVAEIKEINFIPSNRVHIVTTPTGNGNRVDITLSGTGVYYSGICTGTNKLLVSLDGASYYSESTLSYNTGVIEQTSYSDLALKAGPADPSTDGTGKRAQLQGSDALVGSNANGGDVDLIPGTGDGAGLTGIITLRGKAQLFDDLTTYDDNDVRVIAGIDDAGTGGHKTTIAGTNAKAGSNQSGGNVDLLPGDKDGVGNPGIVNIKNASEYTDGINVPISSANKGRLRYNDTLKKFEQSVNSGNWLAIATQSYTDNNLNSGLAGVYNNIVSVYQDGTLKGTQKSINFINGGTGIVSVTNNTGQNRLDVVISGSTAGGGGGAPIDGLYLVVSGQPLLTNSRIITAGNFVTLEDTGTRLIINSTASGSGGGVSNTYFPSGWM